MPDKIQRSLYIPSPKLNKLHILQQIALDPHVTQAEMARQCSLSVAMVNNYLKELRASGMLTCEHKSSRSIIYLLTGTGQQAMDQTCHELTQELVQLSAGAKDRIRQMILRLVGADIRRAVLYGTGDLAQLVFHALEMAGINIVGVCDETATKARRDCCGRETINPSQIRFVSPDSVIIATFEGADEAYVCLSPLQERGIRLIRLDRAEANDSQVAAVSHSPGLVLEHFRRCLEFNPRHGKAAELIEDLTEVE